jgi:NADH-quinone oxidoreductase subunit N
VEYAGLFENQVKAILPEIYFATFGILIAVFGSFIGTSKTLNYPLTYISILLMCASSLIIGMLILLSNPLAQGALFNGTYIVDYLSNVAKFLIMLSTCFILFSIKGYHEEYRINPFEYFVLIMFAVLGLCLLVGSSDILAAYLAIELQSLCLYVLAAFKRDSAYSIEAGLKYFVLGAFSSSLLLFGGSFLYGITGSTNLVEIVNFFVEHDSFCPEIINLVNISIIFISVGLLFKLAAAPFHMWSPDVYEGSPTSSSIFFAVVPKIAIFTFFLRLYEHGLYNLAILWQPILVVVAFTSVLVGAFTALKQKNLKRLLAYSAVSHVGYMLIAFSAGSFEGIQSLFFYLIIYMATGFCLWVILLMTNSKQDNVKKLKMSRSNTIGDLSGMLRSNILLGFSASMIIFSMAGIPPFVGFYAKFCIFLAAINSSMYLLSISVIMISCIAAFYYIRLIKAIYFEQVENWVFHKPMVESMSVILSVPVLLILVLFVNPNFITLISSNMAFFFLG